MIIGIGWNRVHSLVQSNFNVEFENAFCVLQTWIFIHAVVEELCIGQLYAVSQMGEVLDSMGTSSVFEFCLRFRGTANGRSSVAGDPTRMK